MPEFKSLPLNAIPLRVLYIFRQMYKKEIKPSIGAQLVHGVYLAYLCCIYIAWVIIALFCFAGILNINYYGTICLYFIAISITSHMLDKKLKKLMGIYNPLADLDFEFLTTEASITEIRSNLVDVDAIKIYRPAVKSNAMELIDIFFQLADMDKHTLFVLRYNNRFTGSSVLHIVDSTMTHKLHVLFDETDHTISVI